MICGRRQDSGTEEEEERPFTITYCWNQEWEQSDSWRNELSNGQVLMILTAHKPPLAVPLDRNSWEKKLKALGVEVTTAGQWEHLIQRAVLEPEMRKYLIYNSRAIGMIIAVMIYVTLWVNLYSTLQIFWGGHSWQVGILVTGVSLTAAFLFRLIIHQDRRKLNMNTDLRLMAANEALMKNGFLVGLTDILDKHHPVPQLWFVYYDIGSCLQSLTEYVSTLKENQESALKQHLDQVCLVVEAATPGWTTRWREPLEESPLLTDSGGSGMNALLHHECLCLVTGRAPEAIAQQLLTIFSSYYIRLMASGQLPKVPAGRHRTLSPNPCLCQFIETMVLGKGFPLSNRGGT